MYGRMVGGRRQGRAILALMAVLWLLQTTVAIAAETGGNPRLAAVADQTATTTQPGGNLEGKRGPPGQEALGLQDALAVHPGPCCHASQPVRPGWPLQGRVRLTAARRGGRGDGLLVTAGHYGVDLVDQGLEAWAMLVSNALCPSDLLAVSWLMNLLR
jgi:potassium-transporting ATPase potassium-binding subunit